MGSHQNTWSQAADAALITMWNGGATVRAIGNVVGRTRNAVIGRAHRLRKKGIVLMQRVELPPEQKKRRRVYRALARLRKPPTPLPEPVPPPRQGKSLLELAPADCRFIIDSDDARTPTHLYCGRASITDKVCYCAYHAARMWA